MWLLSASLLVGTFAAAIVAIAIAPPSGRRVMGLLVIAVAAIWAIYGQVTAGNALSAAAPEALAAIVGAVAAWLLGRRFLSQG